MLNDKVVFIFGSKNETVSKTLEILRKENRNYYLKKWCYNIIN